MASVPLRAIDNAGYFLSPNARRLKEQRLSRSPARGRSCSPSISLATTTSRVNSGSGACQKLRHQSVYRCALDHIQAAIQEPAGASICCWLSSLEGTRSETALDPLVEPRRRHLTRSGDDFERHFAPVDCCNAGSVTWTTIAALDRLSLWYNETALKIPGGCRDGPSAGRRSHASAACSDKVR